MPKQKKTHQENIMRKCADPRKKVQYIEKTTLSAEDNWDYDKIQRINDNKQKKDFYNATLLVNNV